jgi:glycerophosphoryl diester phosphodiesterase
MGSRRVIGFAHRGMPGQAPDNSVAGYRLALSAGARALEGDVWVSADGHAVLDHDGTYGGGLKSRAIANLNRIDLEDRDTLEDLYAQCGNEFDLSLDIKDPLALEPTLAAARSAGAESRLWLCHPDWELVASWKSQVGQAHLVDSTRWRLIREGLSDRLGHLGRAGIEALNMPFVEWSVQRVDQCHQAGILAFAWHAHDRRSLETSLAMGVDGVFSDDVITMVGLLAAGA